LRRNEKREAGELGKQKADDRKRKNERMMEKEE
jgi:hypothetical protein